MADFRIIDEDFNATEVTVEATSEPGRKLLCEFYGPGAVSFTLLKSLGLAFARYAEHRGLLVAG